VSEIEIGEGAGRISDLPGMGKTGTAARNRGKAVDLKDCVFTIRFVPIALEVCRTWKPIAQKSGRNAVWEGGGILGFLGRLEVVAKLSGS
jgi:hypothetical protein